MSTVIVLFRPTDVAAGGAGVCPGKQEESRQGGAEGEKVKGRGE